MANIAFVQNSLYIGSDEQRTAAEVSRHCFVHDAVVLDESQTGFWQLLGILGASPGPRVRNLTWHQCLNT